MSEENPASVRRGICEECGTAVYVTEKGGEAFTSSCRCEEELSVADISEAPQHVRTCLSSSEVA